MSDSNNSKVISEGRLSVLKGLIGAIPYAGTAINEVLFEARGRLKQERVNSFIEEFSAYLNKFKEDDLNIDQIKSEEFGDLFEELLVAISKTRSIEKRKAFRNLLVNQLLSPNPIDYSLLILEITSSLQEAQIPIIIKICEDYESGYVEYKGKLIGLKKELTQQEKELNGSRFGYFSEEDSYVVDSKRDITTEISSIKSKIKNFEESVLEYNEPYLAKTYGCEKYEFQFLIQDLVNKGLLVDYGMKYNANPFDLVEITGLGMDLVDSLKV
jgi:hypothetical protein